MQHLESICQTVGKNETCELLYRIDGDMDNIKKLLSSA